MLVFRMFNFLNVRQLEETLISNKEFGAQYLVWRALRCIVLYTAC